MDPLTLVIIGVIAFFLLHKKPASATKSTPIATPGAATLPGGIIADATTINNDVIETINGVINGLTPTGKGKTVEYADPSSDIAAHPGYHTFGAPNPTPRAMPVAYQRGVPTAVPPPVVKSARNPLGTTPMKTVKAVPYSPYSKTAGRVNSILGRCLILCLISLSMTGCVNKGWQGLVPGKSAHLRGFKAVFGGWGVTETITIDEVDTRLPGDTNSLPPLVVPPAPVSNP